MVVMQAERYHIFNSLIITAIYTVSQKTNKIILLYANYVKFHQI